MPLPWSGISGIKRVLHWKRTIGISGTGKKKWLPLWGQVAGGKQHGEMGSSLVQSLVTWAPVLALPLTSGYTPWN